MSASSWRQTPTQGRGEWHLIVCACDGPRHVLSQSCSSEYGVRRTATKVYKPCFTSAHEHSTLDTICAGLERVWHTLNTVSRSSLSLHCTRIRTEGFALFGFNVQEHPQDPILGIRTKPSLWTGHGPICTSLTPVVVMIELTSGGTEGHCTHTSCTTLHDKQHRGQHMSLSDKTRH